jgi:sugar lactone lactonase YvrE
MRTHQPLLFATDFVFLEAPRWRDSQLWVSDVFDHTVYVLDSNGVRKKVCNVPHRPSGLDFLPDGTPIVVSSKDRRLMKIVGDTIVEYADLSGFASGDVNDFAVDAQGRIYVGNFGYDYDAGEPRAVTALHRVDPDGAISVAAVELDFPNGSVIVDGGKTLIVAETWIGRLTAFDIDDEGMLGNRRVYADLGERQPDGICADAVGGIWAGCFNTGEFVRVLAGGAITDVIEFKGHAIACTLGGEDGRRLFCTSYRGTLDELVARKRNGVIHTVQVDAPALSASSV